jgi:Dolichyl-phosphate-mannose-protein mannosyltransferase
MRTDNHPTLTNSLLLIIILSCAVKCIFAAALGAGVDESYTIATSRIVDLSVYDHPPLAWWLVSFMRWLSGTESPFILRLPFILCSAVSTWLIAELTQILFGESKKIIAALMFSAAPVLSITTGSWILPDGPLLLFMLACACIVARLLFEPSTSPAYWLLAGLYGGFALLSKYHGLFLFSGTFVFLILSSRHRFWLATPWPYLGAFIGLLIFLPVLLWNARHEWVSFLFQSSRANPAEWHIWMPFIVLLGQALFLCPPIFYFLLRATYQKIITRPIHAESLFLLSLGGGPILIVFMISLWSKQSLFHWAAPGYMMLIPIAAHYINAQQRLWLAYISYAMWGLTLCVSLLGLLPINWSSIGIRDPFADMRSWSSLEPLIENIYKEMPAQSFIATTHWHLTGRLDYALRGDYRVTCLCRDNREYGIIYPLSDLRHQSGIILVPFYKTNLSQDTLEKMFVRLDQRDDIHIRLGSDVIMRFHVYVGYDFNGAIAK